MARRPAARPHGQGQPWTFKSLRADFNPNAPNDTYGYSCFLARSNKHQPLMAATSTPRQGPVGLPAAAAGDAGAHGVEVGQHPPALSQLLQARARSIAPRRLRHRHATFMRPAEGFRHIFSTAMQPSCGLLKAPACLQLVDLRGEAAAPVRPPPVIYDSTFSRTVWRLYGGAKGLVVWY
jgi:hypothetical protein